MYNIMHFIYTVQVQRKVNKRKENENKENAPTSKKKKRSKGTCIMYVL